MKTIEYFLEAHERIVVKGEEKNPIAKDYLNLAKKFYYDPIPTRLKEQTFKTLITTDGNREAIEAVKNIDVKSGEFIYLYGSAGNGKTHLAIAGALHQLANANMTNDRLPDVKIGFISLSSYFNVVFRSFNDSSVKVPDLMQYDLLVIDDFGRNTPSPFVYNAIFCLIEERCDWRKATIFTSNYNPNEVVSKMSPNGADDYALTSRLNSGKVFQIKGKDRRAE